MTRNAPHQAVPPKPMPPPGKGAKAGPPPRAVPKPGASNVVTIQPAAPPAQMRARHWGVALSFFLIVILPLLAAGWYLWTIAEDRYSSTAGFSVRKAEGGGASDFLGGLAQFAAGSSSQDGDILYEFIRSQEIVARIDTRLDLGSHYSARWENDPVFSLWPDASSEDLLWYWRRILHVSYDQATGLIELQILAFDPEMARDIARAVLGESQEMINQLNKTARADAIRYAMHDLQEAVARLKEAREAMTRFRTASRIVDPQADIQGRMGVLNTLQQQLAEAMIQYDMLLVTSNKNDPRLAQGKRRIEVIRRRIGEERETFASDQARDGLPGIDYPSLIAEYEGLDVDRLYAEESYRAALAAVDIARANAGRQERYLATFIQPTLAETAEFPRRFVLMGLAALFLFLLWGILALIYYSIRDRR